MEAAVSTDSTSAGPASTSRPQRPPKWHDERLSIPFPLRLPLAMVVGSLAGFVLGTTKGSTERGLRFRAENAHRFPTTQTGWFLYHKSKNYHMALGGILEGFKMAGRQTVWVGLFMGMEEFIDRGRAGVGRWVAGEKWGGASRDLVSSVLAGMGTAGVFSAWNRFPVPTAARVAKMGAKAGLAYGVLQDFAGLLRGRRLGYVEFVKRWVSGSSGGSTDTEVLNGLRETRTTASSAG